MKSLNDIIQLATMLCLSTRQDVDVYQTDSGIKYKLSALRNSKKHINKLAYENGNVIIRDSSGKVLNPVQKKEVKRPAKKEWENTEGI